jgi:hypothetical protein
MKQGAADGRAGKTGFLNEETQEYGFRRLSRITHIYKKWLLFIFPSVKIREQ